MSGPAEDPRGDGDARDAEVVLPISIRDMSLDGEKYG